jgi:hypothetical protein
MKLSSRITALCVPQVIAILAVRLFVAGEELSLAFILIITISSLLGVVCYLLFRTEPKNKARAVLLNFAFFFEANVLIVPVFYVLNLTVLKMKDADNYAYQFQGRMYYMLLSISVVYLFLDRLALLRRTYVKYLITLLIAIGACGAIYHRYLENPDYLRDTTEIADFIKVRDAITVLKKAGSLDPSAEQVVNLIETKLAGGVKDSVGANYEGRLKSVVNALPYIRGEDYATLYWKPLHMDFFWMSVICTCFLVSSMAFKYIKDPPEGAYVEKIVWCLFAFCAFEALHAYAFTQIIRWEALLKAIELGRYVSFLIMTILLVLFAMRLRFVHTVEGNYYERRLLSDPSRISRWRDAFDNWVLKQFMNPGELDRRFLTQRRRHE